jgi:hypothetical protein
MSRARMGVEDEILRLGRGPATIEERLNRDAAPLGDVRPALDAVMHGDLALLAELAELAERERERERPFDQAGDLEAVVREPVAGQTPVLGIGRRVPVDAVKGGDVGGREVLP